MKDMDLKSTRLLVCIVLTVVLVSFSSCEGLRILIPGLNQTNQILENTINDLNANAANFETTIRTAINEIDEYEIKAQLQDILNQAIFNTSSEIRCDIQFTQDYLIARIEAIMADIKNQPIPTILPQICTVSPSIIDMNLPISLRNKVEISGYALKENFGKLSLFLIHTRPAGASTDITSKLSLSSNYKLIINLGTDGTVNMFSDKFVLKCEDEVLSEIPVFQKIVEPCETREVQYANLPKLVLYPVHKKSPWVNSKGDKEFEGHGPCSEGWVRIYLKNSGTELWAKAGLTMWECPDNLDRIKKDYTYGDVTKEIKLLNVEQGWRIISINETTFDSFQNIDTRTGESELVSGSGPVTSYLIFGDTNTSDLGTSRVEISFKPMRVTLEEIGDCIHNY